MRPDTVRRAYEGKLIRVSVERWGGREREIVEHPGAVAVVSVDGEDRVVLVKQLREATRRRLVELPAGTAEPGESPLATAQRELAEETGLVGGSWRELARFWTTPGFCRERMTLFVAEGVEQRGQPSPDDDERIEVVRWRVHELAAHLDEIEDAKTLAGLLLYLRLRGL